MTDPSTPTSVSPAAHAYLDALTAAHEAIDSYVGCASSLPHLRDRAVARMMELRRAFWRLTEAERLEVRQAQGAWLQRLVDVAREAG